MMSYSDRWPDEGEPWRAIFQHIDRIIEEVVRKYQEYPMKITRWHWDAPDRLLYWIGADELERNIHLFLWADRSWANEDELRPGELPASYELRFEGAIWVDRGRQRRLHQEKWEDLSISYINSSTVTDALTKIRGRLETSYKRVSEWTEAKLDRVVVLP